MFRLSLSLLILAVATQAARVSRLPENVWRNNPQIRNWVDEKIVGGDEVDPNSIPFQVSLQYPTFNFHFCGGSVYNSRYIITAAHCCNGQDPSDLRVNAGEHSLRSDDGTEQERNVVSIKMHEDFSSRTLENDICLLEMDRDLDLNAAVAGVPMPYSMQEWNSGTATVSGWGTLSSGGSSPDKLHAVDVPIVTDADCRDSYGQNDIYDSMICAGEEGKDSCQGDSGGPMTCGGDLCGIVSWGYGCAFAGYPGVYTQASYYIDWVTDNAGSQ